MKKVIIISVTIVICFVALFWITIETNPEMATRLGFASGPGKPIEVTPDAPNAMVPSGNGILIGNKIKSAEDLQDVIWFELITTDLSGKESTYQLPLVLNKVA